MRDRQFTLNKIYNLCQGIPDIIEWFDILEKTKEAEFENNKIKIDNLIASLRLAEDYIDPRSHGWKHYLHSKERKLVEPLLKGE